MRHVPGLGDAHPERSPHRRAAGAQATGSSPVPLAARSSAGCGLARREAGVGPGKQFLAGRPVPGFRGLNPEPVHQATFRGWATEW